MRPRSLRVCQGAWIPRDSPGFTWSWLNIYPQATLSHDVTKDRKKIFERLIIYRLRSAFSEYDIRLSQTIWIKKNAGNLTTMRNVRETVKYFTVSQQLLKCHEPVPRTAESFDCPSGARGLFITRKHGHEHAGCVNRLDNYSSGNPTINSALNLWSGRFGQEVLNHAGVHIEPNHGW